MLCPYFCVKVFVWGNLFAGTAAAQTQDEE